MTKNNTCISLILRILGNKKRPGTFFEVSFSAIFAIVSVFTVSDVLADGRSVETTRFGSILLLPGNASIGPYVLLFSGTDGVTKKEMDLASAMTAAGSSVAILNSQSYLQNLSKEGGDCVYLAGEIVRLSQMVEQEAGISSYKKPIIAGVGVGASLAYIILAQAPAEFASLVSLNFCPKIELPKNICTNDSMPFGARRENNLLRLTRTKDLESPWLLLEDTNTISLECPAQEITDFTANSHSISRSSSTEVLTVLPQFLGGLAMEQTQESSDIVKALIEIKTPSDTSDYFVLLLSGDGGWANIDKDIADYLVRSGVSVLGVSSLKYFWHKREAKEAGEDLDWVIRNYTKKWQKKKVFLVGFSLGADVLPMMFNQLSAESKKLVSNVALLSPGIRASLEVHITDWFMTSPTEGSAILPELNRMIETPILCIYGKKEADETVCTAKSERPINTIQLEGDHHFDGDYEAIARILVASEVKASSIKVIQSKE